MNRLIGKNADSELDTHLSDDVIWDDPVDVLHGLIDRVIVAVTGINDRITRKLGVASVREERLRRPSIRAINVDWDYTVLKVQINKVSLK